MAEPLHGYLAPEARDAEARRLAERAGAELVRYGESVEGRPLLAVRVPSARSGAPAVLCGANIHGVELVGAAVALGLLEALASGALPALRGEAEVWVVPAINPDGYARTWERAGVGRLAELRTNARGVDLNRNFPLPHGARLPHLPGAGSSRPGRATYRGPAPLSEPETRALDALLGRARFHAVLSLHSTMGTLIPARVLTRADLRGYGQLCRAFRAGQRRFRYRRLQTLVGDVFTGELEDHAHHGHRAWASCVEVFPILHSLRQHLRAPSLFWRFNPRRPEDYVANDVPGIAAFFSAALRMPRPGGGA
jgi:predicted deacylase